MRFTTVSTLSTLAAMLAVGACNRSDGARAATTTLTGEATPLTTGDTTLEQRADRARAHVHPLPEPLDGVGEPDRPADDKDEGADQLEDRDHDDSCCPLWRCGTLRPWKSSSPAGTGRSRSAS